MLVKVKANRRTRGEVFEKRKETRRDENRRDSVAERKRASRRDGRKGSAGRASQGFSLEARRYSLLRSESNRTEFENAKLSRALRIERIEIAPEPLLVRPAWKFYDTALSTKRRSDPNRSLSSRSTVSEATARSTCLARSQKFAVR